MRKLLLLSLLIATFAVPMRFSRDPSVVRGLRRTIATMTVVVAVYVMLLVYVFPHLS